MKTPTIADQYACAQREVKMRAHYYPRWVKELRMTQHEATQELETMRAIVATLGRLLEETSGQQALFHS